MAAVVVVIDAGHGGADTGAVALGMVEKDLTLDVARRVAATLARRGVVTRLTRETDTYVPLAARARFANSLPRAVFVSIHFNHAVNAPANGIETFYTARPEPLFVGNRTDMGNAFSGWRWLTGIFSASNAERAPLQTSEINATFSESRALAERVQAAVVSGIVAVDRGVKERRLYVTRNVQGPAVLVEGGFVSNPSEARALSDPAYRQRLSDAVAGGIINYLADAANRPHRLTRTGPPMAAATTPRPVE